MNLIETGIKGTWDKTKSFLRDLDAKDQIEYRNAYEKYLQNTNERYSKIKTIIYRYTPQSLYTFYEHINVSFNGRKIQTNNINNLLRIGNKLIISGAGGVGKSTLFRHLFLNTITNTSFIPVLLDFRSFDSQSSIEDEIYKFLYDNGFELEKKYFQYSMQKGAYVILLDGYDELKRDIVQKISKEIKSLSNKYNQNKYIISSRPYEGFIDWNDFNELVTLNLEKEQAVNLIKNLNFDKSVRDKFSKQLEDGFFEKYQSFCSNPLLLTIMLLTFGQHATISNKLNDFYENAFVTLFEKHDATKDCYKRELMSNLGYSDFKQVFSYLCFKSYFHQEIEFSEEKLDEYIKNTINKFRSFQLKSECFKFDLLNSVCMLVKEGQVYRFAHRSFQEYFAAYYTSQLTDTEQYTVVSTWINERNKNWWLYDETFLEMLFNLQSDRFNKIIICPYIKKIKDVYDNTGFSKEFLKVIYANAGFFDDDETDQVFLVVSVTELSFILTLNEKLNGNKNNNTPRITDDSNAYFEVSSYIDKHNIACSTESMSFDILSAALTEKRMLKELDWIKKSVEFAFDILDKYSKPQKQSENLMDIIDGL